MRQITQLLSLAALLGVVVPPTLFLMGHLSLDAVKWWLLGSTLLWFAVTPLWVNRKSAERPASETVV